MVKLSLFNGFGIELEYMITDNKTGSIRPITDSLMEAASGEICGDLERGKICWSNELVMHVVELKTNGPVKEFNKVYKDFQVQINDINSYLSKFSARLMPSAMHPWMDPNTETKLWSYDSNEIYETFNKIFDCKGHGWSNLQSVHLNLPFSDNDEFVRLHSAIRLILPILPAIAASSPIFELNHNHVKDNRLAFYRTNSVRIPSITGHVIPEDIKSIKDYKTRIFKKIYSDISSFDPDKILQHEWLNARGAITRFERNTIEIRVLDIQECPLADISVLFAISSVLKKFVGEETISLEKQLSFDTLELEKIFISTMKDAENALIEDEIYIRAFGLDKKSCTANELWNHIVSVLISEELKENAEFMPALKNIIENGTLSTRILKQLDNKMTKDEIFKVYAKLCDCLDKGVLFN